MMRLANVANTPKAMSLLGMPLSLRKLGLLLMACRSSCLRQNVITLAALLLVSFSFAPLAQAQTTVCAKVKIEIKQKLSLERQAFDAEMKINNTTDTGAVENVSVVIKVTDDAGTPVAVTDNPNDLSAKFYVRLSNKENISDVEGTGAVAPNEVCVNSGHQRFR
jgi:hypothetical protein